MEAACPFDCPCGRRYTARAIRHDQSRQVTVRAEVLDEDFRVVAYTEEHKPR